MSCYPECPEDRDDCRFQSLGGLSTAMHSPVSYNREGQPVGGGNNIITDCIRCNACDRRWKCKRTELERIQNVNGLWVLI